MSDSSTGTAGTASTIESRYRALTKAVCARLEKNKRVRRNLPGEGRLRIDRQLPFLCVYRQQQCQQPDLGTRQLVTSEASYLFADGDAAHQDGLADLCGAIGGAMQEHFGTFLLIEVWASGQDEQADSENADFEIVCTDADAMPSTIEVFRKSLASIHLASDSPVVRIRSGDQVHPDGFSPLMPECSDGGSGGCCTIGLAVKPIYRDSKTGAIYPLVLQRLRWQLATAIRKTIAEFTGTVKESESSHYDTLGPSSMVKAVRLIDQQLSDVSQSFDFLLQVTPTNAEDAGCHFREHGYRELPPLQYRHLPYHPNLLKRQLFAVEIERIEDPTLAHLFWEKQNEIDHQLTSLRELHLPEATSLHPGQSNFLANSLQLYGAPEEELVELAREILQRFRPDRNAADQPSVENKKTVGTNQLVQRAREEIDHYHTRMSEFNAKVEVSDRIASGIMVSQDRLLIANNLRLSPRRVTALLHHEIGTHLLTYFNGRCQPLRQMYAGLAGYEELQEGLAVLAEYLVGGLTRNRMRTLAARVIATRCVTRGESFADVYRKLHRRHRFSGRQSFTTALRVFRGGGLTKDLIYLRGLRDLLVYLAAGHDIEPLYVGKIGLQHVPYIQELRRRGIIEPPRLLPRFLDDAKVRERLDACRGKSVLDLMETDR
ncbi:flavohemoglobin expression-modulating QEGLA motif protein [Stieleria sp. TO1_6]|uniref:flavohemoglobin expression-modulating QEGLA motif protein n=1 Tax=Stieleria tagensis TaxID=2956795 RepID=UPI00209AA480|nr:flavohemoglobin expression-modulating QEGLA motif protein [Stieleria tagensis]MCO8121679.1 flavohemoglobin expression-modulating QEGLA motif protein [Stieleria tagensis]